MNNWNPGKKDYHQQSLSSVQKEIIRMIEPGSSVLDVGCATGFMAKHLKEDLHCKVTGVELNPIQASEAIPHCDELIIGDISKPETLNQLNNQFDYVVFADVLEHLIDPWDILKRTHSLLKPNGKVIASIPNVAYFTVRIKLLLGRFDYTPYGILDETHLRFFTRRSALDMFRSTQYCVDEFTPVNDSPKQRLLLRFFPDALSVQFVISVHQCEQTD